MRDWFGEMEEIETHTIGYSVRYLGELSREVTKGRE